jgi:hypothetical protein
MCEPGLSFLTLILTGRIALVLQQHVQLCSLWLFVLANVRLSNSTSARDKGEFESAGG